MGILSDLPEIMSTIENRGHAPSTSALYALANKKWAGRPVVEGFMEAEGTGDKFALDVALAEKYSSTVEDLPRGVVEGYINPKDAVSMQSMVGEDLNNSNLVRELGSDAVGGGRSHDEQIINTVNEYLYSQHKEVGYGDWAKTLLTPVRNQFFLNEVFDTPNADSLANFTSNYQASTDEEKVGLMDSLINKLKSIDGYDIEKLAIVNDVLNTYDARSATIENFFGIADVAGVGSTAMAIKQFHKAGSVSKTFMRAGKNDDAGQAAAAAIEDPSIAKRHSEDVDGLISNIITNDRIDKHLAGTETVRELNEGLSIITNATRYNNEIVSNVTKTLDDMLLSSNFSKSDIAKALDNPEEGLAPLKQKFMDEFDKTKIKMARDGSAPVPTHEILSFDANSGTVKVKYSIKGEIKGTKYNKDGSLSKRGDVIHNVDYDDTQVVNLTSDVHSTLDGLYSSVGVVTDKIASPKFKFRTMNGTTINRIIEDAGLDLRASERLVNTVQDSYYNTLKRAGLTKKSDRRKHFEDVLVRLDAEDHLASVDELLDVHMLNEKEATAYYNINKLLDISKIMEDHAKYRKAYLGGGKNINVDGQTFIGRIFKDFNSSRETLKEAQYITERGRLRINTVYDSTTGKYVPLTQVSWKGKRLVVLDDDVVVNTLDGGKTRNTRVFVVDESSVGDLEFKSFNKFSRESYVPVYRPNAKYFVKEKVNRSVDNIDIEYDRTVASFDNKIDAEKFHAERKAQFDNGELPEVNSVFDKVSYDRESQLSGAGRDRLTDGTKARANKNTIQWHGVTDSSRMRPIEAIARNLSVTARNSATSEWKNSIVTKWQNSVKRFDHNGHINNPVNKSTPEGRDLEELRLYIKSKLSIPSEETAAWEGFTRRVAEFIDKETGARATKYGNTTNNSTPLSRSIRRAGDHNPYSFIKYTTFQSMLGIFNPAQLFVQAQNMTLAMSIHPWLSAKHMGDSIKTRFFLNADDSSIKTLIKDGKITEELADTIYQFKRAGLDNIHTNADISLATQGFGTTARAYKKTLDKGLLFYRNGELAGRTVTFNVARAKYMKQSGKSWKQLSDSDHRNIVELFDNLSLNLNSNNTAKFQHGVLSVPTQFWHVQTKFIESLAGKAFTPEEKWRMIVGQMVLYGAAGVPGGYFIADMLQKRDPDGSGKVLGASSEFVKGGLVNFVAGGELQLSQRGALAYGLEGYVRGLLEDDNKALWQKFMGASGELFKRGSYAYDILTAFAFEPDEVVNETDLLDLIIAMGSVSSTVANLNTAYDMYTLNQYRDRYSGRINFRDPTLTEIFGKGVGISSTREATMWEDALDLRKYKVWKTSKVNQFFRIMTAQGVDPTSYEAAKWLNKTVPAYASLFGGGNKKDVEEITKSIFRKLKRLKKKSKKDSVTDSIIKNIVNSEIAPIEEQE